MKKQKPTVQEYREKVFLDLCDDDFGNFSDVDTLDTMEKLTDLIFDFQTREKLENLIYTLREKIQNKKMKFKVE